MHTSIASMQLATAKPPVSQLLVRFQNGTLVYNHHSAATATSTSTTIRTCPAPATIEEIVIFVATKTAWPVHHLRVTSLQLPYCTVSVTCSIRGGKGGFGTLLRSSSRQQKQATTDFGACRDLQGRRLRHTNEQQGYQKWKEWHDKVESGQATEAEMVQALLDTASGIAGWHLPNLPSWGENAAASAAKQQKRQQTLYKKWLWEKKATKEKKDTRKAWQEQQVQSYISQATVATERVQASLETALQQGLATAAAKKRAHMQETVVATVMDPPAALVTLTGEVVVVAAAQADKNTTAGSWHLQTKSNFATAGMILVAAAPQTKSESNATSAVYYEVRLVTAGLAQIGWAMAAPGKFQPNDESGDGVGDCAHSWAYDPSQRLFLHNGKEKVWNDAPVASAGDVIGCAHANGKMQFYCNGEPVGQEITVKTAKPLYPAMSCNQGEILELRLDGECMSYLPVGACPVGELLAPEAIPEDDDDEKQLEESKPAADGDSKGPILEPEVAKPAPILKATVQPEALDLERFENLAALEALGLDRLKAALMAAGLKCGGSLQERAARLLSVKGLVSSEYPPKLLAKRKR